METADNNQDREFWDRRYRQQHRIWSGEPNPQLVAEAGTLEPGYALDVGCGEGADSLWLASRGWQVTGVDISAVAIERAATHAAAAGDPMQGRVQWVCADLRSWEPPARTFSLVSLQFMHLPEPERTVLFARAASAVGVGGTLLVVAHHPSDLTTAVPRPQRPELFYTADDVAAALEPDQWTVRVSEARKRLTAAPDGASVAVHDTVFSAVRLA